MAFIVAEIGVNWNGDLKLAKKMMLQAKKAGADAVKFQAFNEKIVWENMILVEFVPPPFLMCITTWDSQDTLGKENPSNTRGYF